MKLKVKFENEVCQDFEFVGEKSDWIDLKAAQDFYGRVSNNFSA